MSAYSLTSLPPRRVALHLVIRRINTGSSQHSAATLLLLKLYFQKTTFVTIGFHVRYRIFRKN